MLKRLFFCGHSIPQLQFTATLLFIFMGLSAIAIVNYKIDYLGWRRGLLLGEIDSRKYNAVIAKNQDYNAIIIGSSMSENFKCSEIDRECHVNSLKLTMSGAHIAEHLFLTRYVNCKKNVKLIFLELHLNSFLLNAPAIQAPELYQSESYSIKELVNISTVQASARAVVRKSMPISRDDLYSWAPYYPCNLEVFAEYLLTADGHRMVQAGKASLVIADKNVKEFLVPLLDENQDKEIIAFFPPYSIMAYENNNPDAAVALKRRLAETVLHYPNVRLYDFQLADEVVTNFNNYKDRTHYSASINSWMIEELASDRFRITQDNLNHSLERHLRQISVFDYNAAWQQLRQCRPISK